MYGGLRDGGSKRLLTPGEQIICALSEALHKTPAEIRGMPSKDVFMLLAYLKAKSQKESGVVDLEDVDEDQFGSMIGAEKVGVRR